MRQVIVGFHQDDEGDWVAELACGHQQHVRHNPPWINRPWVTSTEGRQRFLGRRIDCGTCDPGLQTRYDVPPTDNELDA